MSESTQRQAAVAIVMRTKNRPLLLARAVADVLGQSFRDWVLVIVNDGGDPVAVEAVVAAAVEAAAAEAAGRVAGTADGRISVIHNDRSVGMEAASNQGIAATGSVYLSIHDDDDQWHPDFLATTVDHLERTPSDEGVMVRTEIVYERIVGEEIEVVDRVPFVADLRAITLVDVLRYNRGVPISFLYRRRAHEIIGGYDESLPAVGDWEFHLRFLREFTIGFIDGDPLAFWNQRRESTGDLGNSVLDRHGEHALYDLLVRERYLKEDVRRYGLGALLYLTRLQDGAEREARERADRAERALEEVLRALRDVEHRLGTLEAGVSDASLVSLLRRRYRRLKARVLPARR